MAGRGATSAGCRPASSIRIVRFVCGLPPRLQRRSSARRRVDGHEPAPDIQVVLWLARWSASDRPRAAERSRRGGAGQGPDRGRSSSAAPKLPLPRVEDLDDPGPGGPIGARLYAPHRRESAPAPLIVYYHGGGWVIGDLETHDASAASSPPTGRRGALGRLPARARASLPGRGRRRARGLSLGRERSAGARRRPAPDRGRRRQRRRQPGGRGQPAGPRRRRPEAGDAGAASTPSPTRSAARHSRGCSPRASCWPTADMDWFEGHYLPAGERRHRPAGLGLPSRGPRGPAARLRLPPPGSTRCATRARPTRSGCARPATRSRCAAIPA